MQCRRHPTSTFDPYLNCEACMDEEDRAAEQAEREAEQHETELAAKGYWCRRCRVCGRYKRVDTFCSAGC